MTHLAGHAQTTQGSAAQNNLDEKLPSFKRSAECSEDTQADTKVGVPE